MKELTAARVRAKSLEPGHFFRALKSLRAANTVESLTIKAREDFFSSSTLTANFFFSFSLSPLPRCKSAGVLAGRCYANYRRGGCATVD